MVYFVLRRQSWGVIEIVVVVMVVVAVLGIKGLYLITEIANSVAVRLLSDLC